MVSQSKNVLKMLDEIATKEVELATEALASAMKVADDAQKKYDMLIEYRLGYLDNLNKSLAIGMNAEAYQNFQNFFKKLDQAIAGQQDVLETARRQVSLHRELWQESQRKKRSYDVLISRSDKRELKVEQKKDQKMTDEYATRISRTKR
ncbi:MAG: flagellar export protein FliJ [Methylotenera sp.]|nr:flagellar export protein FliJ [Methylotenera sp.]MDO9232913.1 flagellar export protein FliJ [Methylotenera sp.]MDO9390028.1 flagellar export protein FliJ [Methylotenera sp.]MDP2101910.1 flagellar export protein FliJ [Methylotenera sp.]MDP2280148.1 flagellar export protein FliJ [Methylotenera sp.]